MITELNRLKRDYKEAIHYKRRLKSRGKDTLAYKINKKALGLKQHIRELNNIGG